MLNFFNISYMILAFGLCSLFVLSLCNNQENDNLIVNLPKGKIRGHILESANGKPYYAFQEIPYAAPPIGKSRFQPPQEPSSWSGIRNATKNTVVCYQGPETSGNLTRSEDCLYINVYTPVAPGTSKLLPVILYIYGGRFEVVGGAYQFYGPKYLIDADIVVVTFNHRLGAFGFLTTVDDVIPPNLGMKDQLLAMEWVHDNIRLFGGNNSHVTLVGESSGSYSVGLHLLGPWYKGKVLFQAAIQQSGTLSNSTLFSYRSNVARPAAFQVGRTLDKECCSNDSRKLLKVLRKASAEDILAASASNTHWPIQEKEGPFCYQMYEAITNENFKKIPMIIGFNSEEYLYNLNLTTLEKTAAYFDEDPANLIGHQFNISYEEKFKAGQELKKIYTNTTFKENLGGALRYMSDTSLNPVVKQALLLAEYQKVYLYEFAYKGPLGNRLDVLKIPGAELVAHAEDVQYMWDDGTNSDLSQFPYSDRLTLYRHNKLWTNFIKYHNPTPEDDPLLQNVHWLPLDPKQPQEIKYLNINETLEIRKNPRYYQEVNAVLDPLITPNNII